MSLYDLNLKNTFANEFVSSINQGERFVIQLSELLSTLSSLRESMNNSVLYSESEKLEVDEGIAALNAKILALVE